tara:strand:+ start:74 stop:550 length:477 start_codon:yes stop_codon:yes gene_type:complete
MENCDYIEKQYFGLNKMSILRRISLVIFCLIAYFWRENQGKSGDLYFFIGIGIIFFSILLLFILHFKTKIINDSIILEGLWTARKVKINIFTLESVKKVEYSKYILNRSVYNLHVKGTIRFYTRGENAIQLTDKDGLIYLIGTQKPNQLYNIIQNKLC